LFDVLNVVFSHALRGAGDTRFVSAAALGLAGPVLVAPAWACWYFGWGLYWAWTFASLYVMVQATVVGLRFRQGRWRTMRVIEKIPPTRPDVEPEALVVAVVSVPASEGLPR
jgi:multidrug resistance protein, MATE family